jgi:hypothetical protein
MVMARCAPPVGVESGGGASPPEGLEEEEEKEEEEEEGAEGDIVSSSVLTTRCFLQCVQEQKRLDFFNLRFYEESAHTPTKLITNALKSEGPARLLSLATFDGFQKGIMARFLPPLLLLALLPAPPAAALVPHPRIILTPARLAVVKAFVATNAQAQSYFAALEAQGAYVLAQPPLPRPPMNASDILMASRSVLTRITVTALLYRLTGNATYAARVIDELLSVTQWQDWDIVKHALGASSRLPPLSASIGATTRCRRARPTSPPSWPALSPSPARPSGPRTPKGRTAGRGGRATRRTGPS